MPIIDQYPDCCGVGCISDFFMYSEWGDEAGTITPKEASQYITSKVSQKEFGMLTIALAGDQIKILDKTVKSFGFKALKTFRNPNTGNSIRFYHKIVNQPKDKQKKLSKPRFA
jgi:hypothetical protein